MSASPERLTARDAAPAELLIRGAILLDPGSGIEGSHDIVIRAGEIAEVAAPGSAEADGAEVVEAEGLHAFPAFFDLRARSTRRTSRRAPGRRRPAATAG